MHIIGVIQTEYCMKIFIRSPYNICSFNVPANPGKYSFQQMYMGFSEIRVIYYNGPGRLRFINPFQHFTIYSLGDGIDGPEEDLKNHVDAMEGVIVAWLPAQRKVLVGPVGSYEKAEELAETL